MKPRAFAVLFALLAAQASALTIRGTVEGAVTADTRVAAVVVNPYGQAVQEVSSVPVEGGRFTLELPVAAPTARAQVTLTPQNVNWPGVIDPIQVSGQAQVAELKFFTYRDLNNNGRRDENEALRDVLPTLNGGGLFVAWVNTDVTVKANKGYEASFKRGWNAFIVDVGRAVKVQPFADSTVVSVRLAR
ncbi:hypothetical protein GO986_18220 [Deinococcus sp. HMF7620]|uniref:Carboxypeptidase regulatory-like domain-containing protein n=1 Tax=Deinococcus arboris TaxID=2682977 RepID=A0A7C9LQM0_9DEIO|nr:MULTISPECIES: hypothetical protein [Deinococcus]MBZ9753623.1 hypothetical protein [Deinococcus betulae]MVN88676.1 hypothetical protein [Deinococcus arboris]